MTYSNGTRPDKERPLPSLNGLRFRTVPRASRPARRHGLVTAIASLRTVRDEKGVPIEISRGLIEAPYAVSLGLLRIKNVLNNRRRNLVAAAGHLF
ncbi:hypothetical protein EVAR_7861_1 [Eumeta japonica]|uniref:Uncharacterized protein n=1 Tax=Eumeta variegata TaxID=151549 RepID=A0A4C1TVE2_EUMVA|nr:hypothetical protein EVAR_7861_1 [Eumeta japonica]